MVTIENKRTLRVANANSTWYQLHKFRSELKGRLPYLMSTQNQEYVCDI